MGGYRGLRAAALDRLASRASPAPWCAMDGVSGLKVRIGRQRAWQHALRWREDVQADYRPIQLGGRFALAQSGVVRQPRKSIENVLESGLDIEAGLQEVRATVLRQSIVKMLARDGRDLTELLGRGLDLSAGLAEINSGLASDGGDGGMA